LMLGAAVLAGGVAFLATRGDDDPIASTTEGGGAPIDDARAPALPAPAPPDTPVAAASVDAGAVPVPVEPKLAAAVAAPVTTAPVDAPVDAAPARPVEVAPVDASAGIEPAESAQSAGTRDSKTRDRRIVDKRRDAKSTAEAKVAADAKAAAEAKTAADAKAAAEATAAKAKAAAKEDPAALYRRVERVTKRLTATCSCRKALLGAYVTLDRNSPAAVQTYWKALKPCAETCGASTD
jgi:hypothetical protein